MRREHKRVDQEALRCFIENDPLQIEFRGNGTFMQIGKGLTIERCSVNIGRCSRGRHILPTPLYRVRVRVQIEPNAILLSLPQTFAWHENILGSASSLRGVDYLALTSWYYRILIANLQEGSNLLVLPLQENCAITLSMTSAPRFSHSRALCVSLSTITIIDLQRERQPAIIGDPDVFTFLNAAPMSMIREH